MSYQGDLASLSSDHTDNHHEANTATPSPVGVKEESNVNWDEKISLLYSDVD